MENLEHKLLIIRLLDNINQPESVRKLRYLYDNDPVLNYMWDHFNHCCNMQTIPYLVITTKSNEHTATVRSGKIIDKNIIMRKPLRRKFNSRAAFFQSLKIRREIQKHIKENYPEFYYMRDIKALQYAIHLERLQQDSGYQKEVINQLLNSK